MRQVHTAPQNSQPTMHIAEASTRPIEPTIHIAQATTRLSYRHIIEIGNCTVSIYQQQCNPLNPLYIPHKQPHKQPHKRTHTPLASKSIPAQAYAQTASQHTLSAQLYAHMCRVYTNMVPYHTANFVWKASSIHFEFR